MGNEKLARRILKGIKRRKERGGGDELMTWAQVFDPTFKPPPMTGREKKQLRQIIYEGQVVRWEDIMNIHNNDDSSEWEFNPNDPFA